MKSTSVEKIFKSISMIKDGHFELASGLHSGLYFEKFRLLEHPKYVSLICKQIADAFADIEYFSTVAGPTTGGVIIAYEVARKLNKRCIFAEKTEQGREFLRSYNIEVGERILVVDDILTTGGSIEKTIEAIVRNKGILAGVGVVVDRTETPVDFGVPFFAAYKSPTKNYNPTECPLCNRGLKLIKPGGKK